MYRKGAATLLTLGLWLLCTAAYPAHLVEPAPALNDLNGKPHKLSEYIGHGRWVLVNVWSPWCPFCRRELQDLVDFHDEHKDKDAMVVGVTLDFPGFGYPKVASVKSFVEDYFVDFPVLLADANLASRAIGQPVDMIPITYFYDPSGKLRVRWNGVLTPKDIKHLISDPPPRFEILRSHVPGPQTSRN